MTNKWTTNEVNRSGYNDKLGELLKDEYGVILLQGKNAFGDFIYSYVQITLPNLKRFYNAFSDGTNFNPSDFGTVIAAGTGKPTRMVVQTQRASHSPFGLVSDAGNTAAPRCRETGGMASLARPPLAWDVSGRETEG